MRNRMLHRLPFCIASTGCWALLKESTCSRSPRETPGAYFLTHMHEDHLAGLSGATSPATHSHAYLSPTFE